MLDVVRTSRVRVVALIALFTVAGAIAAATDGGEIVAEDEVQTRDHIAAALRDEPRTPVLVPREMPDGYELGASPAPSTPGGGPGSTWVYRAIDGPHGDTAVISVCIVAGDPDAGERTCTPEGTEAIAHYEHEGFSAFVVPMGPDANDLDDHGWHDLDLTAQWENVDWIDS